MLWQWYDLLAGGLHPRTLSSAWPWIAGASLLGACVSPSLLALAQSLDRD